MPGSKRSGPNLLYEKQMLRDGFARILGMDEVGRGAWAGPVTVGAVALPLNTPKLMQVLKGVRDSKQLSPRQREQMIRTIEGTALAWGIGSADNQEIDNLGINPATRLAMQRALDDTRQRFPTFEPDCLFLDSMLWPETVRQIPQVSILHGDSLSLSIAAASIIAKVWRDALMRDLDTELPQYQFGVHKGYGTAQHQSALKSYGPSPLHRTSYEPIRQLLNKDDS